MFCGECRDGFAGPGMEGHYLNDCPMLQSCTHCTQVRHRNGGLVRTYNSLQEGAIEVKFVPFCSLSDGILFCWNQKFQILAENHGL